MFRQSLKLPASVIRKYPLFWEKHYFIRLYQTSSVRCRKQIEGEKQECPNERSGRGLYYTLGAVLIGTGAVVVYAKHDDEFRKWLRDNVPGSDEFISFVTAEETSPVDFLLRWIADTAALVRNEITTMVTGKKAGLKDLPPCDEKQEPYVPPKSALATIEPPPPPKFDETRTLVHKDDQVKIEKKSTTAAATEELSEALRPTNLKQLEEAINNAAKTAISSFTEAVCVLRDHAEDIYQLVESSVENVDPKIWPKIKRKGDEREKIVATAEKAAKKAMDRMNKLQEILNDPKFPGSEETKQNVKRNIRRIIESVDDAKKTFEQEQRKVAVTDRYWTKVQEARRHFSDELEILFPNVKLSEKKIKFAEGEVDLFILYAFQNILFYQKELSKLDTLANLRLQQALEQSKLGDPQAIDAAIEQEVEKEKRKVDLEFQKRMLGLRAQCERDMRVQMKRQAEAHSDHLQEAIVMKEKEMERKLQRTIDEKLQAEKIKFKEEVAAMVAKLRGIDDIMKCRASADRRMRASQALWSACQALESALRSPYACAAPATDTIKPLENEISAILKSAAKDDELVDVVVGSIPKEARTRGVYSESVLKERFLTVERVAKRVALLPDGGASLPVMLLSYIQSFFIISPANPIPPYELANEPVEVGKFNTFEILQRARYWVDRGDLAQAVRYMNLLQGAAHVVSKDWCNEARIYLETLQAATVLMAHASAAGLAFS